MRGSLVQALRGIRKHRRDPPIEECLGPLWIIHGIGEQRVAGLPDFGDDGRAKQVVLGVNGRATKPLRKNAPIPGDYPKQDAARDFGCTNRRRGQSPGLKARDNESRRRRRARSGEQSADDRPGCRFPATFGLQLDISVQAEFGEKRNGLRQRRDPLPRKGSIEPAPGIAITHRF